MTPPPGGGNGAGQSQGDQQQRQSWYKSLTKAYTYSNRPLVTPGRSPSLAPSKLQALLGFVSGDGQQPRSQSSMAPYSPTPANRPAPQQRPRRSTSTNLGSNTPNPDNDYDGVFQPPSDSNASLVQAQQSCLQSQQAQADTPDIQFLQAEIDRAHEKQSERLLERSIETLLEMMGGG